MTPEQAERFMEKVMPEPNTGCWLWIASTRDGGYGQVRLDGTLHSAHRVLYEHAVGSIPDGLFLDHRRCDTPACVNPSHMAPATNRENTLRGNGPSAACARQTHCKRGHELAGDNLAVRRGQRICRECSRQAQTPGAPRVKRLRSDAVPAPL